MTEGVMTPLVNWAAICQDNIDKMKKKDLW